TEANVNDDVNEPAQSCNANVQYTGSWGVSCRPITAGKVSEQKKTRTRTGSNERGEPQATNFKNQSLLAALTVTLRGRTKQEPHDIEPARHTHVATPYLSYP
uniref:hypothetical protein n=1 Tax=Burkholderia multivorans TaxID=87883 RepID=UPI0021C05487